ncbi:MAG: universal stress protein, partial [Acidobacteriota bacterium]
VGTSLTEASDPVVRAGAELARCWNAELHFFHAFSLPVAYFAAPAGVATIPPNLIDSERQVRRRMLDEQLRRLELDPELPTGVVIEAGAVHRMLLDNAAELDADLIVVGASETPGRVLRGNTADRVLRQATCPVWIATGLSELPPRRTLAPVDLSPLSESCLRRGLELLDALPEGEGAAVDALFVLTDEERQSSTQFSPEQIERLAYEELDRFVERLAEAECHPIRQRRVRIGDIRTEVVREIEQTPTDLLLLGTHGRSGFERLLLGSVASDLASRAPCDVLIVPPIEALEEALPQAVAAGGSHG